MTTTTPSLTAALTALDTELAEAQRDYYRKLDAACRGRGFSRAKWAEADRAMGRVLALGVKRRKLVGGGS